MNPAKALWPSSLQGVNESAKGSAHPEIRTDTRKFPRARFQKAMKTTDPEGFEEVGRNILFNVWCNTLGRGALLHDLQNNLLSFLHLVFGIHGWE